MTVLRLSRAHLIHLRRGEVHVMVADGNVQVAIFGEPHLRKKNLITNISTHPSALETV